jgi:ubiquinone/menaquinone biosynthesis C-methylase UbiE
MFCTLDAKEGAMEGRESRKAHWEDVYTKKDETEVSWFQENPAPSLELIAQIGATPASAIIDVGGGASRLVDKLIEKGFQDVTVLDLSEAALGAAKARLRERAAQVHWIVADATIWEPVRTYDIWHDRAAFHFLTEESDRSAYIAHLKRGLKVGGHAIIATFAMDLKSAAAWLSRATIVRASVGRSAPCFNCSIPSAMSTQRPGIRNRFSNSASFNMWVDPHDTGALAIRFTGAPIAFPLQIPLTPIAPSPAHGSVPA